MTPFDIKSLSRQTEIARSHTVPIEHVLLHFPEVGQDPCWNTGTGAYEREREGEPKPATFFPAFFFPLFLLDAGGFLDEAFEKSFRSSGVHGTFLMYRTVTYTV
jgi:hypothetical protein